MQREIEEAGKKWEAAPVHVKAIASAYMLPILEALRAIGREVEALQSDGEGGSWMLENSRDRWGPFQSEDMAWRFLMGRPAGSSEVAEYMKAGWRVTNG